MEELNLSKFQKDIKGYLESYTDRLFDIELSPKNLEDIFSFDKANERHNRVKYDKKAIKEY